MAFFDENENENENEGEQDEVEKIKLGDQEFEPDELQEMVGTFKEIEEQHGGVDKLKSLMGKQADELGKLRKEYEELKQKAQEQEAPKQDDNDQLTPDQIRKNAEQIGFVTKESVNNYISNYMQAQKLLERSQALEEKGNPYEAKELPKFDTEDMLSWMDENNIREPEQAYKLRYEDEIDEWKSKQLNQSKPKGIHTEQSSSPGGKSPKEVKIDLENLQDHLAASLRGEL